MNTDEMMKALDNMMRQMEELSSEIESLKQSAKDKIAEAEALNKQAKVKEDELKRQRPLVLMMQNIAQNMVAKSDVEEILEDLESSPEPDFKSARSKLGIEKAGEEDPPEQKAVAQG